MRNGALARFLPLLALAWLCTACAPAGEFQGERAYRDVQAQMRLGPRLPGSQASREAVAYFSSQLEKAGWTVEEQRFTYQGVELCNLIAAKGSGPLVIVGAHYDCRAQADRDPNDPQQPVPGANDGASGTAVLLELARTLGRQKLNNEVRLAFFDAEDQGEINQWPWSVGAEYLAAHLDKTPQAAIVVDMVGDARQNIYWEASSDPSLRQAIWAVAGQLGYGQELVPAVRFNITDDHTPFLRRDIPAVDIIDFDYPYWHTTKDTADKVSPASLERVGRVLEHYLRGE